MEHCNCALVGFGKVGELEFCTSITDSVKEFYCAVLKGDWQILSWLLILKSDSIDRTSHMACRNTVAKLIAELSTRYNKSFKSGELGPEDWCRRATNFDRGHLRIAQLGRTELFRCIGPGIIVGDEHDDGFLGLGTEE